MFLLLPGEAPEHMTVLGIILPCFILGKAAHFPPVAPPQDDIRRVIGRYRWRDDGFSPGDHGVDSL